MKRMTALALALLLTLSLSACGKTPAAEPDLLTLDRVGFAPFAFTAREQALLRAFDDSDSALFLYQAPPETKAMTMQAYTLQPDGTWSEPDTFLHMYSPEDDDIQMEGFLSLQFNEDDSARVTGNGFGTKVPPIELSTATLGRSTQQLQDFQAIEFGRDIPFQMTIYTDNNFYSANTLADFFTPEALMHEEYQLVRVLTVTFYDERPDAAAP